MTVSEMKLNEAKVNSLVKRIIEQDMTIKQQAEAMKIAGCNKREILSIFNRLNKHNGLI